MKKVLLLSLLVLFRACVLPVTPRGAAGVGAVITDANKLTVFAG